MKRLKKIQGINMYYISPCKACDAFIGKDKVECRENLRRFYKCQMHEMYCRMGTKLFTETILEKITEKDELSAIVSAILTALYEKEEKEREEKRKRAKAERNRNPYA